MDTFCKKPLSLLLLLFLFSCDCNECELPYRVVSFSIVFPIFEEFSESCKFPNNPVEQLNTLNQQGPGDGCLDFFTYWSDIFTPANHRWYVDVKLEGVCGNPTDTKLFDLFYFGTADCNADHQEFIHTYATDPFMLNFCALAHRPPNHGVYSYNVVIAFRSPCTAPNLSSPNCYCQDLHYYHSFYTEFTISFFGEYLSCSDGANSEFFPVSTLDFVNWIGGAWCNTAEGCGNP